MESPKAGRTRMGNALENCREVPGFPGYFVDSSGSVYTVNLSQGRQRLTPKRMQPQLTRHGYCRVKLYGPRRDWNARIESIVLIAFVGPQPLGCEPVHLDGDRKNNSLPNLKYSEPLRLPEIPSDFGNWMAGLVDGEGSFGICNNKSRYSRGCSFCVHLRDDDAAILIQMATVTGIGKVRFSKRKNPNQGDTAEWRVTKKAECLLIVELFERFPLRAKKARDFAIWRRAVEWWCDQEPGNRWHGARSISFMMEMKQELEEGRKYHREGMVIA